MENFSWIGNKLESYLDLIKTIRNLDKSYVHRNICERESFVNYKDLIIQHRYMHNESCYEKRLQILDMVKNGNLKLSGVESLTYMHSLLFEGLENAGNFNPEQSHLHNVDKDGLVTILCDFAKPEDRMENLERAFDEYNSSIQENPELSLVAILCLFIRIQNIHPFLDGNGRCGRLLIQILMYQNGFQKALDIPLEYYFLKYKDIYNSKYPFSKEYCYDTDFGTIVPFMLKLIRLSYSDEV